MFCARERRKSGVEVVRRSQSWSKTAVVGMWAVSGSADYGKVAGA
jgi:hypothetical protein